MASGKRLSAAFCRKPLRPVGNENRARVADRTWEFWQTKPKLKPGAVFLAGDNYFSRLMGCSS
jgi:hypothetical protein